MRIRPVGAHALLLDCTAPTACPRPTWSKHGEPSCGGVGSRVTWPPSRSCRRPAPSCSTACRPGRHGRAADPVGAGHRDRRDPVAARTARRRHGDRRSRSTSTAPDLPTVAEHWGVDVPDVRARLTGTEFRVAFCGFAPGFAYLTGLPDELALPRLATPRPRVPAGSVALAGPYAGIYPTRVARRLAAGRPHRPGPLRRRRATRRPCSARAPAVRFARRHDRPPAHRGAPRRAAHHRAGPRPARLRRTSACPGPARSTRRALRLANRLVGNPPSTPPAWRSTLTGCTLRLTRAADRGGHRRRGRRPRRAAGPATPAPAHRAGRDGAADRPSPSGVRS